MRALSRFMANPFVDRNISTARLIAFSTDHLQRMRANNTGGELSARIAATTSALEQAMSCLNDDLTQLGVRKSRKMSKNTFRKSLRKKVAGIVAAVTAEFGPGSAEEIECCPNGRSVFSTCQDDAVSGHLQTLIGAVTAHQAVLGAALVTRATDLKAAWVGIYSASESSTGTKAHSEAEKRVALEGLQLALYLNLIKIMELHATQPEKLALYMQQSLLEAQVRKKKTREGETGLDGGADVGGKVGAEGGGA